MKKDQMTYKATAKDRMHSAFQESKNHPSVRYQFPFLLTVTHAHLVIQKDTCISIHDLRTKDKVDRARDRHRHPIFIQHRRMTLLNARTC